MPNLISIAYEQVKKTALKKGEKNILNACSTWRKLTERDTSPSLKTLPSTKKNIWHTTR